MCEHPPDESSDERRATMGSTPIGSIGVDSDSDASRKANPWDSADGSPSHGGVERGRRDTWISPKQRPPLRGPREDARERPEPVRVCALPRARRRYRPLVIAPHVGRAVPAKYSAIGTPKPARRVGSREADGRSLGPTLRREGSRPSPRANRVTKGSQKRQAPARKEPFARSPSSIENLEDRASR